MEGEGEGEAGEACADDGDARCWGGHCLRPRTSEMEGVDGCLYDKYLFGCIMMKTAVVAVVAVVIGSMWFDELGLSKDLAGIYIYIST